MLVASLSVIHVRVICDELRHPVHPVSRPSVVRSPCGSAAVDSIGTVSFSIEHVHRAWPVRVTIRCQYFIAFVDVSSCSQFDVVAILPELGVVVIVVVPIVDEPYDRAVRRRSVYERFSVVIVLF